VAAMVLFIWLRTKELVSKQSLSYLECLFVSKSLSSVGAKIAVKAMQKVRISDYDAFKNEIAILKQLVTPHPS
jgi:hypothetical protein